MNKNKFYFSKRHKCFKHGSTWLIGVMTFLERTLWPQNAIPRIHGARGGLERGKRIHNDIALWVQLPLQRRRIMDLSGYATYARRLIIATVRLKIVHPHLRIWSELPVGCINRRVGTACDLVAEQPNGTLVLVEWKSGYGKETSYSRLHSAAIRECGVPMTMKNIHFCQLVATRVLFEHTFQRCIARMFLIRVHSKGVTVYKTPKWTSRLLKYFREVISF